MNLLITSESLESTSRGKWQTNCHHCRPNVCQWTGKKETKSYIVNKDEGPRAEPRSFGLRPVFEAGGSVTAGNSSQMSDGAAFYL
jgi:acetyl-CoA acetyltransferase